MPRIKNFLLRKESTNMLSPLPKTAHEFMTWSWAQVEPYFKELESRPLTPQGAPEWLADWTQLSDLINETHSRLNVATSVDTTDKEAENRLNKFLDDIFPKSQAAGQKLKKKLLESRLEPHNFEVPLRNMRTEAALFREANLPLFTQEEKLSTEYDKIIGAQTVQWEGREVTISQLRPVYHNLDRAMRERAWMLGAKRQLADRDALNALWGKFMDLRRQVAANADLANYREFKWRQLLRFEYTPDDCTSFHHSIEQVVVPAALRIYAKRRKQLGVKTLRPWDLDVDPFNRPPLRPFKDVTELEAKATTVFHHVDPQLGKYFEIMRAEKLLDLDNRKGKAPGGYCTSFPVAKRPFIFANSVGLHVDVQTLLHESGHAFHNFERNHLPYYQQRRVTSEFAEVASMAMELLASPYLSLDGDGFYSKPDAARARVEHLEKNILFWPYMAVVDAFQQWVYENHAAATDPDNCDKKWTELWRRFMRGVDWGGLEQEEMTGWHRKLHIFQVPFYYVEYGLAQLGAVQVWANALRNQANAVASYRKAMALGGTLPIPKLFQAAGARFAFDAKTLGEAVNLMERTIEQLENQ